MKIIYNNLIPFRGFSAMMLFGVIFARKSAKPLSLITINHEAIHDAQAHECGGYIFFYILYIRQWMKFGYRNCPFEQEAYNNEHNLYYLRRRNSFEWKKYLENIR
jgi:hypothetical protein